MRIVHSKGGSEHPQQKGARDPKPGISIIHVQLYLGSVRNATTNDIIINVSLRTLRVQCAYVNTIRSFVVRLFHYGTLQ